MKVDVAVVGASLAGLRAAAVAAEGGASVVLLEARREIGVPEPPAVVAFDHFWDSPVRPAASEVRRRVEGVRLASPAGHALVVDAPAFVLERRRFDRRLADLAERAGARVLTGVSGLSARGDRRLVADGIEVEARVVVFADGAATLARRFLRTVEDDAALRWGAALAVDAPLDGAGLLHLRVGAHAPGGRSQLNPLAEGWSHWTFWRGPPLDVERRARAALAVDARAMGWDLGVVRSARLTAVQPDPVATLPREIAGPGVVAVGGAAGQGGVEVGLVSGEMAGAVVAAAVRPPGPVARRDLARYERAWKRRYLAGYRALARTMEQLADLDDARLDRLVAPWDGRRLPVATVLGFGHPSPLARVRTLARAAWEAPDAVWGSLAALGISRLVR